MKLRGLLAALAAGLVCSGCVLFDRDPPRADAAAASLLEWRDVRRLAQPGKVPPLSYGTLKHQVGELRLPPGVDGPFPVLVLIPGPCWDGDGSYLRPLAASLATLGVATWTIDYRAAGKAEAWSEPLLDVARATDHLRALAQTWPLDLRRVAVAGHGGGGQLALWLASRGRIRADDALYLRDPLTLRGVIGLAAVTDLQAPRAADDGSCSAMLDRWLADAPADVATALSPSARLPLRVPQWLVHGARDARVPSAAASAYAERARRRGDRVTIGITTDAGHWEPVVPGSATWMTLQQAVVAALLQ